MGFVAVKSGLPPGLFAPYAGFGAAPEGWLVCDGSLYSRTTYGRLFAKIGIAWGYGDGSTTFNVPDSKGRVLRFFSGNSGNDPDAASRFQYFAGTFSLLNCQTLNTLDYITVASTAGLTPGLTVSGPGIPASTVIRDIMSATQFRLGNLANTSNVNATATATVTLTIGRSAVGNYVGSFQNDTFGSHQHGGGNHQHSFTQAYPGSGAGIDGGAGLQLQFPTFPVTDFSGPIIAAEGGSETRPKNFNATAIIKF